MPEPTLSDTAALAPRPCQGYYVEDIVPDTLEIAGRAALAVNGLIGPLDSDAEYELYWAARFFHNPPFMYHDWNDWCEYKFWEALPLLRIVSGSRVDDDVDAVLMQRLLRGIGPDGLFYLQLHDRPWRTKNVHVNGIYLPDGSFMSADDPAVDRVSIPFIYGRILGVLTIHYLRDGDPHWRAIIERMIDRLAEFAVVRGARSFFPTSAFAPHARSRSWCNIIVFPDRNPHAGWPDNGLPSCSSIANISVPTALSWKWQASCPSRIFTVIPSPN